MACDLNLGEDQRQIIDAAASMLNASYPVARLRHNTHDDLAALADFGLFALALPEDSGGAGFSLVEEALVHAMLGRHIVSTRALATALAARLALVTGRTDLGDAAVSGRLAVCAAIASGDGLLLIDPEGADVALLFAQQGLSLIDVASARRETVSGLGHDIPLARIAPASAPVLGETGDMALRGIADLLICAQLLGNAEATRDLAVDYAKIRQQFGRPIGAFQAIKHHCAGMSVATEMLSSLLDMTAIAQRDGRDDAAFQTACLWALAPKAALGNARICIQVHGGIGFSAEADAHRFLKQAHILSRLGSDASVLDHPAPLSPHNQRPADTAHSA